jgi:hypothetical protein
MLPVAVLVGGRLLAKPAEAGAMRRRAAIWTALAGAVFIGTEVVQYKLWSAPDVQALGALLVVWGAGHWMLTCLAAAALANGYGVLLTQGRQPRGLLVSAILLAAVVSGGWGLVALAVALQAWLFRSAALVRRRPTTSC